MRPPGDEVVVTIALSPVLWKIPKRRHVRSGQQLSGRQDFSLHDSPPHEESSTKRQC
ncbi:hypothetical protein ACFL2P_02555 [Candidatus Moduliflexota bacterium]